MKVAGIVVEYNPLHNGHIHHINKTREITNCDVLIAVMSGNFTQRGEPAIIDKWSRTKAALENGVDIVLELPFIYVNQSAQQFADGAIHILNLAKIDSLVFGSESNNIEELIEISELPINTNYLKEKMNEGYSYPEAYGLLAGSFYPNDILGISYLKALKNTSITPYSIQRTNHYHEDIIETNVASASAIRNALCNNKDFSHTTPMYKELQSEHHFINEYYPVIRTMLITSNKDKLSNLFLMSEGIENHLVKNALIHYNYEDFINATVTKRYTRSRIQRSLMAILVQLTKEEVKALPKLDTIRVLGFNEVGQKYLKELKKQEVKVATKYNQIQKEYRDIELKSTFGYASVFTETRKKEIEQSEISKLIIV